MEQISKEQAIELWKKMLQNKNAITDKEFKGYASRIIDYRLSIFQFGQSVFDIILKDQRFVLNDPKEYSIYSVQGNFDWPLTEHEYQHLVELWTRKPQKTISYDEILNLLS